MMNYRYATAEKTLVDLLRLALRPDDRNIVATAQHEIACLTAREWRETLILAYTHRLMPMLYLPLRNHGLDLSVPQPFRDELSRAYRLTLFTNRLCLGTLDSLLKVMEKRGLRPVIWKGAVLLDHFYPDMGMRIMSDIDIEIPSKLLDKYISFFEDMGFIGHKDHGAPFDDAICFRNQMGVTFDVHHRARLFEGKEPMGLSIDLAADGAACNLLTSAYRVLEPNAMLVQLVTHMEGHACEIGPMLCWLLDVAYVLRKWGDRIELERIKALFPARDQFAYLCRTIRFFQSELGETIPKCLSETANDFDGWTFAEIFRQRRLAHWGLPGWRGWLRLGASCLGLKLKHRRSPIRAGDLIMLLHDIILNYSNGINIYGKFPCGRFPY
jgi:hypothetical protein